MNGWPVYHISDFDSADHTRDTTLEEKITLVFLYSTIEVLLIICLIIQGIPECQWVLLTGTCKRKKKRIQL